MLWGQGVPRREMIRGAAVGALCLAVIAFAYTARKGLGEHAVSHAEPSRPVRVIEMAASPSVARKEQESAPQPQRQ
jgi:hypothetical protein